jgi:hypothetical protein
MATKRNVTREVVKEKSSTPENFVNTFHYTHSFDPALTEKVSLLLTARLGNDFLEEAGHKKWSTLQNNIPANNSQFLALLSSGYITINYMDQLEDSGYVINLLQTLAKDIDQQLQLS